MPILQVRKLSIRDGKKNLAHRSLSDTEAGTHTHVCFLCSSHLASLPPKQLQGTPPESVRAGT